MDDLWFYDINAHAWICLYPGTNTKTFTQRVKDKATAHRRERAVDRQRQAARSRSTRWFTPGATSPTIPTGRSSPSSVGTAWATDPPVLPGRREADGRGAEAARRAAEGQEEARSSRPWFYDVASGQFERSPANNSTAINAGGFPQFHYLPSRKQFFAVGSDTVAIYDPAKNQWTDAKPKGPIPKGYDACGCYDSKRGRIYRNDGDGSKGEGLMAYDIEGNSWSHLKPTGTAPAPANTNAAFYEYDARLDIVVAIHFKGKTPGIFVYDPKTQFLGGPDPLPGRRPQVSVRRQHLLRPGVERLLLPRRRRQQRQRRDVGVSVQEVRSSSWQRLLRAQRRAGRICTEQAVTDRGSDP